MFLNKLVTLTFFKCIFLCLHHSTKKTCLCKVWLYFSLLLFSICIAVVVPFVTERFGIWFRSLLLFVTFKYLNCLLFFVHLLQTREGPWLSLLAFCRKCYKSRLIVPFWWGLLWGNESYETKWREMHVFYFFCMKCNGNGWKTIHSLLRVPPLQQCVRRICIVWRDFRLCIFHFIFLMLLTWNLDFWFFQGVKVLRLSCKNTFSVLTSHLPFETICS